MSDLIFLLDPMFLRRNMRVNSHSGMNSHAGTWERESFSKPDSEGAA